MKKYQLNEFKTADALWAALRPECINTELNTKKLVYRGQSDSTWQLMPNASRNSVDKTVFEQAKFEIDLLVTFLNHCDRVGIVVPSNSYEKATSLKNLLNSRNNTNFGIWPKIEYIELLAFAQHFGVSTCLLDWSKSSFVAAYFAAIGAINSMATKIAKNEDPQLKNCLAIWLLDAEKISFDIGFSAQLDLKHVEKLPVYVFNTPSSGNKHIAAQQGCFSVFSDTSDMKNIPPKFDKFRTMDEIFDFQQGELFKWTLPYSEAVRLIELCDLYGVNASSVYPTSSGAGLAVNDYMNIEIVKSYISQQ